MKKIITLILFVITAISLTAQTIPNGSFENIDAAGNLQDWKINKGVVKRSSAQFWLGYPFTATEQVFFISIENDTLSSPVKTGEISNTFSINGAPPTLVFDAFYAPRFLNQRYGMHILFTKWRNNTRDTIMYVMDTISPVLDSVNVLLIRWTEKRLDLRNGYRDTAMPDSATITIQNDIVSPFSNTTFLLLDNFQFSSWKVGVDEVGMMKAFAVFPNPANDLLNLDLILKEKENVDVEIYDMFGQRAKELHDVNFDSGKNQYQINVADIPCGIYFIKIGTKNFSAQKKFILSH